ncbi:MAG: hypothetical protein E6649_05420 [Paeniclostridium sordellii]|nr:hypothetical protein [Paeniclostridium sordellii]
MATKYLKDEKGAVSAVTTTNLQLEKPLVNENYDVNVFNRNMDKIDTAIQNINLDAPNISITDSENNFESSNVEGALAELAKKNKLQDSEIEDIKRRLGQQEIEINGQRLRGIEIANSLVTKLNTVVGGD